MIARHDRFGERLDDDDADPYAPPPPTCLLCSRRLRADNATQTCAECRALVYSLFGKPVPERWAPAVGLEGVLVSDQGRVARLLPIDRSGRYPRFCADGRKVYLHHAVAEAFHGERPPGLLVLHADDDPDNPTPGNLRYGTHLDNSADAKRNAERRRVIAERLGEFDTRTTTGTAPVEERKQ